MTSIALSDFDTELPEQMNLAVVMLKTPSQHPWIEYSYQAVGVVPDDSDTAEPRLIHRGEDGEQYLIGGMTLKLYEDECESYYHNLMSPNPGCFIVAGEQSNPDDMPEPYLISLSFDEVHAYLEGDEQVFAVDIPADLYRWAEAYVLTHYAAEKKTRRKRKNWTESEGDHKPESPLRRS